MNEVNKALIIQSKVVHNLINWPPIKKFLTTNRFAVRTYFNFLYLRDDPYKIQRAEENYKFEKAFSFLQDFKAKTALEIGCGEGKLTKRVAEVSEKVLAIDISDIAINKAKKLHGDNKRINFRRTDFLDDEFMEKKYDLIFCSEVLYYLSLSQLKNGVEKIISLLASNGKLLLVHSRSLKDDTSGLELKELGAKTVHELFIQHQQLELEADYTEAMYRITLLRRK